MLLAAIVLMAAAVVRSSDGVPIHYTDQGKGEPALVFVHCWACDLHLWDGQVPAEVRAAVRGRDHRRRGSLPDARTPERFNELLAQAVRDFQQSER